MQTVISKISSRQSNMELLRILAMFLVVVTHVNFFSIGWPTPADVDSSPTASFVRIFMESLSIVSVNVFVLISGWFGINITLKKFYKFVFQCLFFSIGIWLFFFFLNIRDLQWTMVLSSLLKSVFCADLWFVYAYIGLLIMAPVLNQFIGYVTPRVLRRFLLCFFIFEFIYGWIFEGNGFNAGYSVFSFIGLYMLGRYLKLYPCRISQLNSRIDSLMYFGASICTACICLLVLKLGINDIQRVFSYLSPLVILASVALLLCFSKLTFQNRAVNYIAASSFSVFLFHMHPEISPIFSRIARDLFVNNCLGNYLWKVFLFVVAVYLIATFIDQLRLFLWSRIESSKCQ